jgi:serine/threonine protein kinase
LDEFELGPILGVGTAGTIYDAHDRTHDRQVALKVLLPTVSSDELIQARFAREMVILEKLSHPNIVRYYGGGRSESQLFFAMELLTAGSLKDELARGGPFSWIEAATCGEQIASALQHAHNHGVIHRDLKPSNLLFDNDGTLKLVDFGIARDTHEADITNRGLTVGSHAYMSPEQITGDRTITGQTDLYSLGVLLYELLAGHPPFSGDNFAQLFHQHLNTQPRPLREFVPELPPAMEQLILRLLAKLPEQRPANARAAQGALRAMLSEKFPAEPHELDVPASHAVDMGRQALSQRLTQRPREVSWTILGGLALAAGTLIWAAWYFGA